MSYINAVINIFFSGEEINLDVRLELKLGENAVIAALNCRSGQWNNEQKGMIGAEWAEWLLI